MRATRTSLFTARRMAISSRSSATAECATAPTRSPGSRGPTLFPRIFGTCCRAVSAAEVARHEPMRDELLLLTVADDNATMGSTYLRTCDSQSNALGLILKETASHGSSPITLSAPPCDPDGSYYPKQCDGSQCFCRT